MGMLDRIYADLLIKMNDLEEFMNDMQNGLERSRLITQEVTIRFQLRGEDKYLNLTHSDIMGIMESNAIGLRRELSTAGMCKETK